MKIAVDVMGGDHAPAAIIAGAVAAARQDPVSLLLVGQPAVIEQTLAAPQYKGMAFTIVPAQQVVAMHEKPANVVRAKPDSSLVVACDLVRRGEAAAVVTAGNTGAALAAGIFKIGRAPGVLRPALVSPFPTKQGFCVILDIGANAEVRPEHLQQFAMMGALYAQQVLGIEQPRVGLLSNGEEEGKGNQLVLNSFPLLAATPGLHFAGNIESKEVIEGLADVVVTDGFTGNIFIKTAEATARLMQAVMVEEVQRSPITTIGALLARPALRRMRQRLDDSEVGGAVLLGLAGLVVVAHGRSDANAIRHAIRVAKQGIEQTIVARIGTALASSLASNANQPNFI
ncbi:MAG: phosphate acyltransferase PlsX [Caldilineaceae bacterium]|nr:phosphate acyltransferase PlsX [Caldilineaceae bacterium]